MNDFLSIAWPALLALIGLLGFIGWGIREYRRIHPRGRYRRQG